MTGKLLFGHNEGVLRFGDHGVDIVSGNSNPLLYKRIKQASTNRPDNTAEDGGIPTVAESAVSHRTSMSTQLYFSVQITCNLENLNLDNVVTLRKFYIK